MHSAHGGGNSSTPKCQFVQICVTFSYLILIFINCQVEKNVFVIFYSGERAKNKILKICDAFGANRYPFVDDLGKQFQMITEVQTILFKGFLPVIYVE